MDNHIPSLRYEIWNTFDGFWDILIKLLFNCKYIHEDETGLQTNRNEACHDWSLQYNAQTIGKVTLVVI